MAVNVEGLPISDITPCVSRARYLCRKLDEQLLSSLSYLSQVCSSQGGLSTYYLKKIIHDAYKLLDTSDDQRLSGSLVASYTLLEDAIKSSSLASIEERLKKFKNQRVEGSPIRIIALGDSELSIEETEDLKEVFIKEMAASSQNTSIFNPTDPILADRSKQAVHMALEAVRIASPELFNEIGQIITDILIIESSKTNAASSFRTFGVIYLKTLKPFQTWTTYVEHIVHEAAHHLLFAIFNEINVFERSSENKFKSPLRSDLRPLDAVFHAMFVLSRIIFVLKKINENSNLAEFERTATYSFYNPAPLIEQFRDAYSVIKHGAILTNDGEIFLDGINRFAESNAFNEQPLKNIDANEKITTK